MKKQTAISVMALMLLTVFSLISVNKPPAASPEIKAIIQSDSEECNATTYQIYPEAMTLWNTTWNAYYNTESTNDGVRSVKGENLLKLHEYIGASVKGSRGVRMYYGLVDAADSIPDLFLINTVNCKNRTDDDVLLVRALDEAKEPVNEWISRKEADGYINNWQSKERSDGETIVYAYNYGWEQLWSLVGEESTKDLDIIYGLRTLSPQENATDFQSVDNDMYGSIVYVNVLYTSQDANRAFTNGGGIFDDFTRPCPQFCDPDTTNITPLTR